VTGFGSILADTYLSYFVHSEP